jgi:protein-tyrosine phosphatase
MSQQDCKATLLKENQKYKDGLRGPTALSVAIKNKLQNDAPDCVLYYKSIVSYLNMTTNCEIKSSLTMLDDHLYIGGQSAMNLSMLKKYKITHIINTVENNKDMHQVYASEASQIADEDSNNLKYLRFSADDDENYPIMDHFQDVFEFIENAYKEGGRCLIHCIMGINRSGVLATAYMMIKNNIGPFAAVKRVQRKRGRLLTNNAFISKLLIFAKTRGYLEKDQLFSLQSRWISDLKIFPKGMEVLQKKAPECIPYYNIIKDVTFYQRYQSAITIRETGQSKTEDRAHPLSLRICI